MTWTQAVDAVANEARANNLQAHQLTALLHALPPRSARSDAESIVWVGLSRVYREHLANAYRERTCDDLGELYVGTVGPDGTTYLDELHGVISDALTNELERRHGWELGDAALDTLPEGTRWVDHYRAAYMAAPPCEKHA